MPRFATRASQRSYHRSEVEDTLLEESLTAGAANMGSLEHMSQGRDSFGLAVSQRCLDRDPSRAVQHARQVKIHRPAVSNTTSHRPVLRAGLSEGGGMSTTVLQMQMH